MAVRLSILAALVGGLACGGPSPRSATTPADPLSFEETAFAPPAELAASRSPLVIHLIDVGQGAALADGRFVTRRGQ